MSNLTIHVNVGTTDDELNVSGVDYVEFSEGNDSLVFTQGNAIVADGQPIPGQSELVSAGSILTGSEIILSEYLLSDFSDNLLKKIDLMGNVDGRYTLAFNFDGSTASEPVLEVWDDNTFLTATGEMLGGGSPSSSFIRGITTTFSTPGVNWAPTAIRMSGATSGNFLFLNDQNGALSSADILYANLAVIIPSSLTVGFSANPVLVCKWLSN